MLTAKLSLELFLINRLEQYCSPFAYFSDARTKVRQIFAVLAQDDSIWKSQTAAETDTLMCSWCTEKAFSFVVGNTSLYWAIRHIREQNVILFSNMRISKENFTYNYGKCSWQCHKCNQLFSLFFFISKAWILAIWSQSDVLKCVLLFLQ